MDIFINHFQWSSVGALRRLVNLTREDSLGTWFSSTQMIACGVVLLVISLGIGYDCKSHKQKKLRNSWRILAIFFTYLGVDDAIKFHERIGTTVKEIGNSYRFVENFPSYTWQLVFGPFLFAMGLYVLIFLWKQASTKRQRILLLSALSLFAFAVGIDFIEGMRKPYEVAAHNFALAPHTVRHFAKVFEEFLEMLGTTFFLWIFLEKLEAYQHWQIQLKSHNS